MSRGTRSFTALILSIFLGCGGCCPSGPGAAQPPLANPTQISDAPKSPQTQPNQREQIGPLVTAHYRGLGFMEQYNYIDAEEAFREVHDLAPQWIPGSINMAIALFYQPGDTDKSSGRWKVDKCLSLLEDVIARDPKNPHAHYCRGLILSSRGLLETAHSEFQLVVDNDPNDAHAWYMLGSTVDEHVPGTGSSEQLAALKKALECNPCLMAAVYKLAIGYRNAGDLEAFRRQLDLFRRLNGGRDRTGPGEDTNNRYYGDIGRYAQVISPSANLKPPLKPVRRPGFEAPVPIEVTLEDGDRWVSSADFTGQIAVIGRSRSRFGAPVAVFDADGDGLLDLYLAAAIAGPQGVRDALLLNRGSGRFEDVTKTRGLPLNRPSVGAAAGDFDADGLTDLFLTGVGDNRLYRNQGSSGFKDVTKESGIAGIPVLSLTARWLDFDQDGDLDLYVVNYTGTDHIDLAFTGKTPPGLTNSVYRNDGKPAEIPGRPPYDWAPRAVDRDPKSAASGLSIKLTPWTGADALLGGNEAHTGLAWLDLDDDRDLDFVVSAEGAVPLAILNDRLGRFRKMPLKDLNAGAADCGLLVTDFDQDGRPDLGTLDAGHGLSIWRNRSRPEIGDVTLAFERWPGNAVAWRSALAADIDLDGWPDLLGLPLTQKLPAPEWARNDGKRLSASPMIIGPDESGSRWLEAITFADIVGDALPDLVMIKDGDTPRVSRNLGNGHHWLSLGLSGRWVSFYRLRTNSHGFGARILLHGPGLNVIEDVANDEAGLSQSLVPTTLGLGDQETAALVRIRWPDGNNQAEFDIPTDQRLIVVEKCYRVAW